MTLLIARRLLKWGWSVVPIPHGQKSPDIRWLQFQSVRPTDTDFIRWWTVGPGTDRPGRIEVQGTEAQPTIRTYPPEPGIGVICGRVSEGLIVLDFDQMEAYELWKEQNPELEKMLPSAKSSRGVHVFCRSTEPIRSGKFALKEGAPPAGDLISEGKLVVLPPTIHPDGTKRQWIRPPFGDLPRLSLRELGVVRCETLGLGNPLNADQPFAKGQRHDGLVRIAMRLTDSRLGEDAVNVALQALNQTHCKPPLPIEEVRQIAQWAAARPVRIRDNDMIWMQLKNGEMIRVEMPKTQKAWDEKDKARELSNEEMESAFMACDEYLHGQDEANLEWLVDGFLPEGYLVILGGTSKAGKSCFLTAMAMAVAKGEKFIGLEVKQSAVLWSCYEESRSERSLALKEYPDQPQNFFLTHEKPLIDTEEGLKLLKHWIEKTDAKLLVIDPLYGANSAESLTDGKSARNALQGLKDLCNETGCTAIVVHHFTKNVSAGLVRERLADSNQITATASMDILMDAESQPGGTRVIKLVCKGRGTFANQTWLVHSKGVAEFELLGHGEGISAHEVTREREIVKLLDEQELSNEGIAKRLGLAVVTIRSLLPKLVKDGLVEVTRKEGQRQFYRSVLPID